MHFINIFFEGVIIMKNTKKILLGYLFAALFVLGAATLGANLVGCGGDDCEGKPPTTSGCTNCPTGSDGNCTADPS